MDAITSGDNNVAIGYFALQQKKRDNQDEWCPSIELQKEYMMQILFEYVF